MWCRHNHKPYTQHLFMDLFINSHYYFVQNRYRPISANNLKKSSTLISFLLGLEKTHRMQTWRMLPLSTPYSVRGLGVIKSVHIITLISQAIVLSMNSGRPKKQLRLRNRKELKLLQQLLNQCYQPICRGGHKIGTASGERLSALPLEEYHLTQSKQGGL